jgi:hypothetical protein
MSAHRFRVFVERRAAGGGEIEQRRLRLAVKRLNQHPFVSIAIIKPRPSKTAASDDSRSLNRRCREGRIGRPFRLRSEQHVDQLLRRELSESERFQSSGKRVS